MTIYRSNKDQFRIEDRDLAPYAVHNKLTRGRRFAEEAHPFRTDFQRDRDRILHSRSFRRLEYKCQVFLNGTGDHLRTRLTHTIEVAAIARTIARALNLNEDLAETIALAHDLGHTPFGHSGEQAMNRLLHEYGGFDHNDQALRIIDVLEQKYPEYDGLNLTWEVRSGLIKHRDRERPPSLDKLPLPPQPTLESQIADLADDLTYYGHDVDDGLESGLIDETLLNNLPIWRHATEKASAKNLKEGSDRFRAFSVRCLIDMMVGNAIRNSCRNLEENNIQNLEQIQNHAERLVCFDSEFQKQTGELREFLFTNLYCHSSIANVNNAAVDTLRKIYHAYLEKPELMGGTARERIAVDGINRAVADYIAGMTDRFALLEFQRCCRDDRDTTAAPGRIHLWPPIFSPE